MRAFVVVPANTALSYYARRKQCSAGSQYSNAQIADHYKQCVKLSSENVRFIPNVGKQLHAN